MDRSLVRTIFKAERRTRRIGARISPEIDACFVATPPAPALPTMAETMADPSAMLRHLNASKVRAGQIGVEKRPAFQALCSTRLRSFRLSALDLSSIEVWIGPIPQGRESPREVP